MFKSLEGKWPFEENDSIFREWQGLGKNKQFFVLWKDYKLLIYVSKDLLRWKLRTVDKSVKAKQS